MPRVLLQLSTMSPFCMVLLKRIVVFLVVDGKLTGTSFSFLEFFHLVHNPPIILHRHIAAAPL